MSDATTHDAIPATALKLLSLVTADGKLEISLDRAAVPEPAAHEVLVKVLATPINPSDLGLLIGAADPASVRGDVLDGLPRITAEVPAAAMKVMASRLGQPMPVGNEGAGIVVRAGASPAAQALLGKTVAMLGGEMYAQYRCLPAAMCMALPDGTDPRDGASCFVNPLTALSMVDAMRREGHKALIHTAAASNLGQMLNRICLKDGIDLVNIVRSPAQVALLADQGATRICDSSSDNFVDDLTRHLTETGATIAFDAIGGGKLASQILAAMEIAAVAGMGSYSRYGSDTFKQVYIYGALDLSPTVLTRSFGFSWAVSGFLLTPYLQKIGGDAVAAMRARIVDELTTTFASHYSHEISLEQALDPAILAAYNRRATGEKYLIRPN